MGIRKSMSVHKRSKSSDNHAIYDRIWGAIVDRALPPGTRLKEEELCEIFGVGRTRIRNVFLQLAHDHLVDLVPNSGAHVAQPTVREARQVFEARRIVECHLVHELSSKMTADQRRLLEQHVEKEKRAEKSGNFSQRIRLSGEFHLLLARIVDNPVLGDFLRELVSRTSLIIAAYERRSGTGGQPPCDGHMALIEAVASGDAERASESMVRHMDGIEGQLDLEPSPDAAIDLRNILLAEPASGPT